MVFAPGETKKAVEVKIIDDDEWEPDETFFVKLSSKNCQVFCSKFNPFLLD